MEDNKITEIYKPCIEELRSMRNDECNKAAENIIVLCNNILQKNKTIGELTHKLEILEAERKIYKDLVYLHARRNND